MIRLVIRLVLARLVVLSLLAACLATGVLDSAVVASDARPNILFIVGEDHGCELSCYGDPVVTTPNIDRLASQGMLFEHAYVTQAVCSPSRSTIFTGLYPHQNGQLGLATHQYGWFERWPTTYSLLKQAGYRTGLIGKTHIIPLDAVESFVDFRFQQSSNFAKRNVAEYAVQAGEFFKASDEPFFMTVNYPDAHWPLQDRVDGLPESLVDPDRVQVPPFVGSQNPRLREIAKNYYNCMLRLDACVGQLLSELREAGKEDNTLVVFIGDHGAQMARGKVTVYEGGLRIPCIVRWPGKIQPGGRSEALVSTIDLLPTFMDATGTASPIGLPGKSLASLFQGAPAGEFREYLACERNCDAARHTFPQRTLRDARYKIIYSMVRDREDPAARYYRIHGATHWSGCPTDEELAEESAQTQAAYARWLNPPEIQLYDLQNDPHEWKDLAGDPTYAEAKQRMLAALKRWQAETRDPLTDPAKLQMLMDENDAVFQANRRSPAEGWQYLEYLHPDGLTVKSDSTASSATMNVLFIGNSYTARHNLAQVIKAMAEAGDANLQFDVSTVIYGGRRLVDHWRLGSQNIIKLAALTAEEEEATIASLEKMAAADAQDQHARAALARHRELLGNLDAGRKKWDIVVLQSYRDDLDGEQSLYVQYARKFAELIHAQGAQVVLYETTPTTQNAEALTSPPDAAPIIAKAKVMAALADRIDAKIVPMSTVALRCQRERPDLPLRFVNDAHLNQNLAYLTACTFYAVLFDRSPEGLPIDRVTDIRFLDDEHRDLDRDGAPITRVFNEQDRNDLQRIAWEGLRDFHRIASGEAEDAEAGD